MTLNEDELKQRLFAQQESFSIEWKSWLDPNTSHGIGKIAKACMALRNNDGGFLIIGICDDGTCDNHNVPLDIRSTFHPDRIQEIVSKYSSDPFEIKVHFLEREGHLRVMLEVMGGLTTPVICKKSLSDDDPSKKKLILQEDVAYVRTLIANHRVSTSIAKAGDWPRLTKICHDNREADIGAFLRRHLSGISTENLTSILQNAIAKEKVPTSSEILLPYMDSMYGQFVASQNSHNPKPPQFAIRECAALLSGVHNQPTLNDNFFLRLINTPKRTGWAPYSMLYDFNGNRRDIARINDGVQAFEFVDIGPNQFLDFSRIDESGQFYFAEGIYDDTYKSAPAKKQLEFVLETKRVAEIIEMTLAIAREFCEDDGENEVAFAFRWRGLSGRQLSAWAHPERGMYFANPAVQDTIITQATIPIDIAPSAISPYVESLLKPVFLLFGSKEFQSSIYQGIVSEQLRRSF